MRPDDLDLLDRFHIDCSGAAAAIAEPPLVAAPFVVTFDGDDGPAERDCEPFLDDGPVVVEFEEPRRRSAASPPRRPPTLGLAGSLALHLLPLLLLLTWSVSRPVPPRPIPVQLVIEKPPPQFSEKKPPPGRLASENIGQKAPKPGTSSEAAKPKPKPVETPAAAPPKETLLSALPPPDKPVPLAEPAVPPLPIPPPRETPRRPAARPHPAPRHVKSVWLPLPHAGAVPGPAATRDEYLAYLVTITRRHFNMLPASLIAGRSGQTILAIRVYADGTIAQIAVASGSGYPDVDAGIERMVASIRRFPPLPQWYQGDSMELKMRLRFPEALAQ